MNTNMKTTKLEKERLKLFKEMLEYESMMDTCLIKELARYQFKYIRAYKKLKKIDELIISQYPNITDELDYAERINYKKLTK